uniref:Uncharacterized protein n=1 Tax=Chromera velia CCMP2878 TaxID=1169474 RepID=A0A0G4I1X7_9ALVE|eukprot:Cvel_10255.t1-p1 / transcript=Cvel_10255.t1 / gene=Cvel_10255 / organism=Chromera_velia_CCMP2878 / gene_product=hypothetical protein / transcript_product=hypothetical protein / location=Cvel_scaffold614:74170-75394(-) / protein_length=363 / sequence_SO=supercontig / SO=protein_coding / is_pseudo=false
MRVLVVPLLFSVVAARSPSWHAVTRHNYGEAEFLQETQTDKEFDQSHDTDQMVKYSIDGIAAFSSNCAAGAEGCRTSGGLYDIDLRGKAPVYGEFASKVRIAYFWKAGEIVKFIPDGESAFKVEGMSLDVDKTGLKLYTQLQGEGIIPAGGCSDIDCINTVIHNLSKWLDSNWKAVFKKANKTSKLTQILLTCYDSTLTYHAVKKLVGKDEWGRLLLAMILQIPRVVTRIAFQADNTVWMATNADTSNVVYAQMEANGMVQMNSLLMHEYFDIPADKFHDKEKYAWEVTNFVKMLGWGYPSTNEVMSRHGIGAGLFEKVQYLFRVCAAGPKTGSSDRRSDPKCTSETDGKLLWTRGTDITAAS